MAAWSTVRAVGTVLVATDSDQVFAQVDAALGSSSTVVVRVREGRSLRPAVAESEPELVLVDLQIGSMGGFAATLDLRLEEGAGRLDPSPIILLLDREADEFLARRSGADHWLVKPFDALALRMAATAVLEGEAASSSAGSGAEQLVAEG